MILKLIYSCDCGGVCDTIEFLSREYFFRSLPFNRDNIVDTDTEGSVH
jgi:hypothetical protein